MRIAWSRHPDGSSAPGCPRVSSPGADSSEHQRPWPGPPRRWRGWARVWAGGGRGGLGCWVEGWCSSEGPRRGAGEAAPEVPIGTHPVGLVACQGLKLHVWKIAVERGPWLLQEYSRGGGGAPGGCAWALGPAVAAGGMRRVGASTAAGRLCRGCGIIAAGCVCVGCGIRARGGGCVCGVWGTTAGPC